MIDQQSLSDSLAWPKELACKIDRIFNQPAYLIDLFPKQVPFKPDNRYFDVEEYFQSDPYEQKRIEQKFCRLLVKLFCYYDFELVTMDPEVQVVKQPSLKQLLAFLESTLANECNQSPSYILLASCDALIAKDGLDLYMTVFNPNPELKDLLLKLSASEGLFFYLAVLD